MGRHFRDLAEQKKHIAIRILKGTLWVLGVIILLAVGLRLSLKTSFVHQFVKNKVVSIAKDQLNATFSIGDLSGDLWSEAKLTNILLSNPDTLLSIDTLALEYDVLSLFSSTFQVNKVYIAGADANIKETDSKAFNLQQVLVEDTEEATTSEPFYFNLQRIQINNLNTSVYSPTYLPDGFLKVQDLNFLGSFASEESISASISDLNFLVKEGRFPEAIQVQTAASFEDETITLQKLVVETGRTVLKAEAKSDLDLSQVSAEASVLPLSLADVQLYLDENIPSENLDMELSLSGSKKALNLRLNVKSSSLSNIEMSALVDLSEEPTLKRFSANGQNLNIASLTNDSLKSHIDSFNLSLEGNVDADYQTANATWELALNGIRFEDYYLHRLSGNGSLAQQKLMGTITANAEKGGLFAVNASITKLFSKAPSWETNIDVRNLDLDYWAKDPALKSDLNFAGTAKGLGFELSDKNWNYSIRSTASPKKNVLAEQTISDFNFKGAVNKQTITLDGFLQLLESKLHLKLLANQFTSETPEFEYTLNTTDFNVAEIVGQEDFPTSMNVELLGKGAGNSLENLVMSGTVKVDSSYINKATLKKIESRFTLTNGVLIIPEGELLSDIVDGTFTGQKNLLDVTDPDNTFFLDLELKNLQPLAPLANLEVLKASGKLQAKIIQNEKGVLQCETTLNLSDIQIDELLFAEKISGEATAILSTQNDFDFNLSFTQPLIFGTILQDINLVSKGVTEQDSTYGDYELNIVGSERGRIIQTGSYHFNLTKEIYNLDLSSFDIIARNKKLALQSPFHVSVNNGVIQTDTLNLSSSDSAYFNLSIPYADSLQQRGWLKGQNFDFGLLQDVLLDERFVDGVLSGEIFFDRSREKLLTQGAIIVERLNYEGMEADALNLNFDVQNERLIAYGDISIDQEKIIEGDLDVPFVLAARESLSDEFFNQPVDGKLTIAPVALSRFQHLLNTFEIQQTSGLLTFDVTLSGVAGHPDFEGLLQLSKPVLSGIAVDSTFASFSYDNSSSKLKIRSEVLATKQKAATADIEVPFIYDFRTFEVSTPDDSQAISANVKTENFNLSVFNDFLNKTYTNKLKGTLNGDLSLKGSIGNLEVNGYMDLTQAELEIPIANIKLDAIKSSLAFNKSGITIKELSAKSGKGDFKASGTIAMEGIRPTTMNVKATANQFKLANTQDYNLTIDLDSKLTGKATRPKATGKLTVKNGFVFLKDFGDKYIEDVQLEGEADSFSPYDSLAMEMQFIIERNFFVRNKRYLDMEIELNGNLDAQKETNKDLALFGTLNGVKGYVKPLGKLFKLDEAQFTFSGPIEDPSLFIKSSYTPNKNQDPVTLYYIIEGTGQNPEFRFDSNPPMEQQDIIAYTVFGRPFYALDSWQQVVSGGSNSKASDILVDVLLDEVESLATRELGIDVVQIDNIRTGTESGTSIKTGWYINQRTFFAIVNEISSSSPKTLFLLEYMLTKDLDLIITQGDNSRQGIDIRWKRDY